jgi:hypothetical protein
MTASGLKDLYERNNPGGHFFDRKTMRFFGDTLCNFGVCDGGTVTTLTDNGVEAVEVWALYRRRPVNGLHGIFAYFRKDNGREVFTRSG